MKTEYSYTEGRNSFQRTKTAEYLCLILLFVLGAVFLRTVLFTDKLIGNSGDARLNVLLAEHWFKLFQGKEKFSELIIFYPQKNVGSYTDMVLALAFPYAIFRLFGMNMFLAAKITLIFYFYVGTYATYFLLRRSLRFSVFPSLLGAIISSFACNAELRMGHTQMLALRLAPVFFIFLSAFFYNIGESKKKKRITGMIGAILIMELILYTSFYSAYFILLFCAVFFVAIAIILHKRKVFFIRKIICYIRRNIFEILCYIVIACVLIIPFMKAYLPTGKLFSRAWKDVADMLPTWRDFINVSRDNLFYGGIINSMNLGNRAYSWELEAGYPFITLAFFLTAAFWAFKTILSRRKKISLSEGKTGQEIPFYNLLPEIIFAMAFATGIVWIFLLKVHNLSLWYLIYAYLPGGRAIRAASRFLVFLNLPMAVVSAWLLEQICQKYRKRITTHQAMIAVNIMVSSFIVLIYAENQLTTGCMDEWNCAKQKAYVNAVSAPPKNCKVMYLIDTSRTGKEKNDYDQQLNSWMIADHFGLKTLNGYSGNTPPEWNLSFPDHEDYQTRVDAWIQYSHIDTKYLYSYDEKDKSWAKYQE